VTPFILKRLALALLVGFTVAVLSFMLVRLSGDVATAIAGEGARQEDIDAVRRTYGLDRPVLVQFGEWLWGLVRGDFGTSYYFKSSVAALVLDKLPVTLTLGLLSLLFALAVSVPLGVLAALYPNSWIDRGALSIAVAGQALPNFFFALLLIMLFSITLRWLPVSGSATPWHYVMPTIALGYYVAPAFMRLIRAGMIEVLSSDFIRTARAKGVSRRKVVLRHALRNALVPVVALAVVQLGYLLGGSVVIETIFALDGLGYLAYQSITHKDLPVMQVVVLLLSVLYVLLTLLRRHRHAWLDRAPEGPRCERDRGRRSRSRRSRSAAKRAAGGIGSLVIGCGSWRHRARRDLRPAPRAARSYRRTSARRLVPPVWYPKGDWAHRSARQSGPRLCSPATLYGARISLLIGGAVALLSGLIGTALGLRPAISAAAST
jgi:peptide/nickel transport system permease protein